jgi:hypothetical protein
MIYRMTILKFSLTNLLYRSIKHPIVLLRRENTTIRAQKMMGLTLALIRLHYIETSSSVSLTRRIGISLSKFVPPGGSK